MKRLSIARGFTFIEILVAIAVLAIITTISTAAFRNVHRESARRTATLEIVDAFRGARNSTLGAQGDTVYGVHVGTSSVTKFTGGTYTAGATMNEEYQYEGGVTATGTLVTSGINVVFTRLTGVPSATGEVIVENSDQTSSTTITIYATGLVEY